MQCDVLVVIALQQIDGLKSVAELGEHPTDVAKLRRLGNEKHHFHNPEGSHIKLGATNA